MCLELRDQNIYQTNGYSFKKSEVCAELHARNMLGISPTKSEVDRKSTDKWFLESVSSERLTPYQI